MVIVLEAQRGERQGEKAIGEVGVKEEEGGGGRWKRGGEEGES